MTEQTVWVVDDDEAVRHGLAALLDASGFRVTCYASAGEFLDSCDGAATGCLLLDINLPDANGLTLQRQLARRGITLPVILITGRGSIADAVTAMKDGAVDFIEKPWDGDALLECVARAMELDRRQRDAAVARHVVQRRMQSLTPREQEVLQSIIAGNPNKRIATDLGISERTVELHRRRVMHKMDARSVVDLMHMVYRLADAGP